MLYKEGFEINVFKSTSCKPDSRVIRAFSDVEKTFLFSDLAVKARISSRVNEFY